MKPSLIQQVFAKDWPLKTYFGLAVLLGLWLGVSISKESGAVMSNWKDVLLLVVIPILVSPVLAFFISLPCAAMFVYPLYYMRARLNGAPFSIGDRVRILVGRHSGGIVEIYAVWEERRQVRVKLDTQAKEEVTDVFSFTQVCRESAG
jgi:hypothetical protein